MIDVLLADEEQSNAVYSFLHTHYLTVKKALLPLGGRVKIEAPNKRWKLIINENLESDLS
ncbi:MAG: hypothetical protein K1W09_02045 [Akkermansia muciniphila]|uniref:hypothetical protein n=1 Tax=uncultured Akkermansia sp. TaxID=512294 RepID=UPI00260BB13E|nr:hypothetical protein [uncultured Akkermansia sp.]